MGYFDVQLHTLSIDSNLYLNLNQDRIEIDNNNNLQGKTRIIKNYSGGFYSSNAPSNPGFQHLRIAPIAQTNLDMRKYLYSQPYACYSYVKISISHTRTFDRKR